MTRSCSQPAWQRTNTLLSSASQIERLGVRSSCAGQRAIHTEPDFRPPRRCARSWRFMTRPDDCFARPPAPHRVAAGRLPNKVRPELLATERYQRSPPNADWFQPSISKQLPYSRIAKASDLARRGNRNGKCFSSGGCGSGNAGVMVDCCQFWPCEDKLHWSLVHAGTAGL